MPAPCFDFDVVTGPSTPREDRDNPPRPTQPPQPVQTGPAPQRACDV